GNCGTVCSSSETCQSGVCARVCPPGQRQCSAGTCFDLQSDSSHCGDCARACGDGQVCRNGSCVLTCPAPTVACGGTCVNFLNDKQNCGGCTGATLSDGGTANFACSGSQSCVQSGSTASCQQVCPAGQVVCGGKCVD